MNDAIFQENGMLVYSVSGPACWIVDPGFPPQAADFIAAIRNENLTPAAIIITHGHVDHIAGVHALHEAFPEAPLIAPRSEAHLLTDPAANLSMAMGLPIAAPEADQLISAGDMLMLADLSFQALDVSGHSPGGLAYYNAATGVVIAGDALFAGSVGRVDFPGSSGERLKRNIVQNLLTLPPQTTVYPGHGPPTTIGEEAATNPYLQFGVVW